MILLINVKITAYGLSHYDRAAWLPKSNRMDIFKYCLASYATMLPLISKCEFYIELAPEFINRRDELEEYIKSLASTLDDHYKLLDLLEESKLEEAQSILDSALKIYRDAITTPLSSIKELINSFDGEIAIKATNDESTVQLIKSMDARYDLALLHPENWVVVNANGMEGQEWLSSWLKNFFVAESKAASLLYLYQKLIKDAGFRVIVHTDSVEPETDLTGEVLRDENMNLTLVRPVIHATKLEILNG